MFTVDQNITDLKIKERNLFKVLFSMNIHPVATPEGSVDDARSYLFFCREGSGKVMSYIGLYFTRTGRKLFYTHSSNPFPESGIADVEAEARAFAEDMGAMLDEIDIAKMSMEEKRAWLNGQDIFSEKKKEKEKPAEPAPATVASAAPSAPQEPTVSVPAPPVQPSPIVPPVVPPPAQLAPAVQPAAPLVQPQVQAPPIPPVAPVQAPEMPTPVQEAPHPKRRQAAPPAAPAPSIERTPTPPRGAPVDDVLDEAVKAGVVKAPKKQLSNDLRSATGKVSRDKEALARLLASF